MPSSFPASFGRTLPTARAAPVVVGMMFSAAARLRRRSLCGTSASRWSFVYACTVVMNPCSIPNSSSRTIASGARQFVVHEAFETIRWRGVRLASLTPMTIIPSISSFGGTVRMTRFAPAVRCFSSFSRVENDARRLHHDLDPQLSPRNPRGVLLGGHEDFPAVHPHRLGIRGDLVLEDPHDRVVLQEVRQVGVVEEVVDRDDLHLGMVDEDAEHGPSDPPEPVDPHADRHRDAPPASRSSRTNRSIKSTAR